jgi:hypothetical protein
MEEDFIIILSLKLTFNVKLKILFFILYFKKHTNYLKDL